MRLTTVLVDTYTTDLVNNTKKNRNSRLLGHVNFDGQNHRFVRKTDLFPDLDITFRILDNI